MLEFTTAVLDAYDVPDLAFKDSKQSKIARLRHMQEKDWCGSGTVQYGTVFGL